jgi:hypothetical protein
MSAAGQMAVAGAALLVACQLILGLVLEEYYTGDLAFALAAIVLVAAWITFSRGGSVPLGFATIVRVAGLVIGLLAVVDLVFELRNGVFDNIADVLGGILYYAGAALLAAAAFRIKD